MSDRDDKKTSAPQEEPDNERGPANFGKGFVEGVKDVVTNPFAWAVNVLTGGGGGDGGSTSGK